ncbi:MAG: phosphoribosylanthranilate isomerase [Sphingomonadales bacterium]|jgi:phosphoribosylanthranilate isomerase
MMGAQVKICGLSTKEAIETAIANGAAYLGFVFFDRSPRNITLDKARELVLMVEGRAKTVAVVVNADDTLLNGIKDAGFDMVQLHGSESPARIEEIKARLDLPLIKAVAVSSREEVLAQKDAFAGADMLLFDAKPPKSGAALPGGNGLSFDWRILDGVEFSKPWALSGGLTVENIQTALALTKAPMVDVSSGVESTPGVKDMSKIADFLNAAKESE